MIYLLGQIALSLLLAGLAGWFVGWSWRGFRDSDRVEDLRRQLVATEEVKDRELAEAGRRADALQTRLDGVSRGEAPRKTGGEARSATEAAGNGSNGSNGNAPPGDAPQATAVVPPEPPATAFGGAQRDPRALEAVTLALRRELETERRRRTETEETLRAQLQAERERRQEAEQRGAAIATDVSTATEPAREAELESRLHDAEEKLKARSAAALSVQAELASLRSSVERKAARLASAEARMMELEPLKSLISALQKDLASARAALRESRDSEPAVRLEQADVVAPLREQLHDRTRELNELRARHNDLAVELEEVRARSEVAGEDSPDRQQEDPSVVASLQEQLDRLRLERGTGDSRWHQQLAARDSETTALRRRLLELEEQLGEADDRDQRISVLEAELRDAERIRSEEIERYRRRLDRLHHQAQPRSSDDLTRIRGVGPKIERVLNRLGVRRLEQIAAWTEDDLERYSDELGNFKDRVRWDDWVGQARQLLADDRQTGLEVADPL